MKNKGIHEWFDDVCMYLCPRCYQTMMKVYGRRWFFWRRYFLVCTGMNCNCRAEIPDDHEQLRFPFLGLWDAGS